jgi:hypothetical protein
MAADDARLALEQIAYGADPAITPSDRLRALQQLAELPGDDVPLHVACQCQGCVLRRDLDTLGDEGLEVLAVEAERHRQLAAAAIEGQVENRARALALQWAQQAAAAQVPRAGDQGAVGAPDAPKAGAGTPQRQLRRAAQALRPGQAKEAQVLPAPDGAVPLVPPEGIVVEAGWPRRDGRGGAAWRFHRGT